MPNRSRKQSDDVNVLAKSLVEKATKEPSEKKPSEEKSEKNPAAVALGRLGGLKGGRVRAERLSAEERKEIARKAARVRWKDKNKSGS